MATTKTIRRPWGATVTYDGKTRTVKTKAGKTVKLARQPGARTRRKA